MIVLIYVQTILHKLSHFPHLFSWFYIGVPIILSEASILAHYFKGFRSIPEGKAWQSFSSWWQRHEVEVVHLTAEQKAEKIVPEPSEPPR